MRTRRVNIFFKKSYLFLLEFHSEQVTLVELAQVIIANTMDGVGHTTGTCVLTVLGGPNLRLDSILEVQLFRFYFHLATSWNTTHKGRRALSEG